MGRWSLAHQCGTGVVYFVRRLASPCVCCHLPQRQRRCSDLNGHKPGGRRSKWHPRCRNPQNNNLLFRGASSGNTTQLSVSASRSSRRRHAADLSDSNSEQITPDRGGKRHRMYSVLRTEYLALLPLTTTPHHVTCGRLHRSSAVLVVRWRLTDILDASGHVILLGR